VADTDLAGAPAVDSNGRMDDGDDVNSDSIRSGRIQRWCKLRCDSGQTRLNAVSLTSRDSFSQPLEFSIILIVSIDLEMLGYKPGEVVVSLLSKYTSQSSEPNEEKSNSS